MSNHDDAYKELIKLIKDFRHDADEAIKERMETLAEYIKDEMSKIYNAIKEIDQAVSKERETNIEQNVRINRMESDIKGIGAKLDRKIITQNQTKSPQNPKIWIMWTIFLFIGMGVGNALLTKFIENFMK